MQVNEETGLCTLLIQNCVLDDKGIYTCEIMAFVKKDTESYCDCIVDIEGMNCIKNNYMLWLLEVLYLLYLYPPHFFDLIFFRISS